ncbi:hypothetical protein AAVH_33095, partial [Aphelenchoides avenae]
FEEAGGGSYQVVVQVDEADRAKQLFDEQPFDGWIGLDPLVDLTGLAGCPQVVRYAFDLRRQCTNGRLEEAAGTMTYGTLEGASCEGDLISLPAAKKDSNCPRTSFQISKVSAGDEESLQYPTDIALATLFAPIAVAYNVSKASHGRYSVECNRPFPP